MSPAASTLRDEMAVSGQRLLAASGQIPMAAHKRSSIVPVSPSRSANNERSERQLAFVSGLDREMNRDRAAEDMSDRPRRTHVPRFNAIRNEPSAFVLTEITSFPPGVDAVTVPGTPAEPRRALRITISSPRKVDVEVEVPQAETQVPKSEIMTDKPVAMFIRSGLTQQKR
jgi:hypothetical protein